MKEFRIYVAMLVAILLVLGAATLALRWLVPPP